MRRRFLQRAPRARRFRVHRSFALRSVCVLGFVVAAACTGDLRFAGDAGPSEGGGDAGDERDATLRDGSIGRADAGEGGAGGGEGGVPGCTTDAECKVPGLHCDVPSHTCVECVSDAHCSGDAGWPHCDPQIHRCVVCRTKDDCPPGTTCESTTRSCVFTCDAGGCPGNRRCSVSRGICIECESSAECLLPEHTVCETATGICQQCAQDGDCPAGRPHCDRTRGLCAQCLAQSDCEDGYSCDFRSNTCFAIPASMQSGQYRQAGQSRIR